MKYTIRAKKWSDAPTGSVWDNGHTLPIYEVVDRIIIEREADSLDEAYKWLLTNLPEYAIGCYIRNDTGDFIFNPDRGYYASFLPNVEIKTIVAYELSRFQAKTTWKVTMQSASTTYDLASGFKSEQEAIDFAEMMDWKFVDENSFEWALEVEEE